MVRFELERRSVFLVAIVMALAVACEPQTKPTPKPTQRATPPAPPTSHPGAASPDSSAATPSPLERVEHLNVIVVVSDALRRDHLSVYGYSRETTPYIDRLAQRAVVFERAFPRSTGRRRPWHRSSREPISPFTR